LTLTRAGAWALLGTLAALLLANAPQLGSDPWDFRPGEIRPHGVLGWVVKAGDRHWDYGFLRTPSMLALLGLALLAAALPLLPRLRVWVAVLLATLATCAVLLPALLLQVGLREATAPWFFTNDSTYQIELAGDLVLDGDNPYGHDYSHSGLERFYSLDGSVSPATRANQVALRHFAYFPGTVLTAAAWRILPGPLDDYRFFVGLCSFALLFAPLLFPGPLWARIAAGAVLAANPLTVRAAWFGTADAPSLLALALAFGLAFRSRWRSAAAALAVAVLLKQFALVALPFLALLAWRRASRREAGIASAIFGGVVFAGLLPFLIADPGALWRDTITYGASTYRIVGYGLSNLLLELGILDDRFGDYPFTWLALFLWAPLTGWLLWRSRRSPDPAPLLLGFTISIFVLLFLGRVFQTSYLMWPLTGLTLTALAASASPFSSSSSEASASASR
jgi:hypothetical protein